MLKHLNVSVRFNYLSTHNVQETKLENLYNQNVRLIKFPTNLKILKIDRYSKLRVGRHTCIAAILLMISFLG